MKVPIAVWCDGAPPVRYGYGGAGYGERRAPSTV